MRIRLITSIGIALIVLSIVAFAYRGIPYTSGVKVIDGGVNPQTVIPMSPLMIGLALVSGTALIAVGIKEPS